jgi:hypothetical protein
MLILSFRISYKYQSLPYIKFMIEDMDVKNINDALYESHSHIEISKYLVEECHASDLDGALQNGAHSFRIQEYLLQKGAKFADISKYKQRIVNLLKKGYGIALTRHPQCLGWKIAQPYLIRQRGISTILNQLLIRDVVKVIIEYVLYEK